MSAPGAIPVPSAPPSYEETTGIHVNYPHPYPVPGSEQKPPYMGQPAPAHNPGKPQNLFSNSG